MSDKKETKGAPQILKQGALPVSEGNVGEEGMKKVLGTIGEKRQKIIIGGKQQDD